MEVMFFILVLHHSLEVGEKHKKKESLFFFPGLKHALNSLWYSFVTLLLL